MYQITSRVHSYGRNGIAKIDLMTSQKILHPPLASHFFVRNIMLRSIVVYHSLIASSLEMLWVIPSKES
ncbi:Uncharacterized protein HZ326_9527 [Fusarium oxysporum f. sp. albedinis]|nr:Uncharacterized protein HZ326_9527 [Fusarium oxysporum f. sp. albedinis]